jgi:hypothetical protein
MIAEKLKQRLNQVRTPSLYFFRDNVGNEVDLLEDDGDGVRVWEIKAGRTLEAEMFKGLNYYRRVNSAVIESTLVYGGDESVAREGHRCKPWHQFP